MNTEYIAPDTTTDEWSTFPFEVDGLHFNSKVRKDSSFGMRLRVIPAEVFAQMNIDCIRSVVGNVKAMTRAEIVEKLAEVNYNGTNAILELA